MLRERERQTEEGPTRKLEVSLSFHLVSLHRATASKLRVKSPLWFVFVCLRVCQTIYTHYAARLCVRASLGALCFSLVRSLSLSLQSQEPLNFALS